MSAAEFEDPKYSETARLMTLLGVLLSTIDLYPDGLTQEELVVKVIESSCLTIPIEQLLEHMMANRVVEKQEDRFLVTKIGREWLKITVSILFRELSDLKKGS